MLLNLNQISLSRKGMILVLVPVASSLLFMGILTFLLIEAELEAERETRAKEALAAGERCVQTLFHAMSALGGYGLTRHQSFYDRYKKLTSMLPSQLVEAKRLAYSQHQIDALNNLESTQKRLVAMGQNAAQAISSDDPNNLPQLMAMRSELKMLLTDYVSDGMKYLDEERAKVASPPASAKMWRNGVKQFLVIGLFANVLVSFLMARFFTRTIVKRLSVMNDNVMRLSLKKQLNPQVEGTDEIATLDGSFHRMAVLLAEAERKERSIIENAVDVICSVDTGFRFNTVSPAAEKVWGYHPDELVGSRLFDLVPDEDREGTVAALKAAAVTTSDQSFESRIIKKNGEKMNVLWSAHWSQAEQALFCVAHDFTERKKAEEAQRASEERIRRVIESMPVGILIADEHGYIELTNYSLENMFGTRYDDLIGQHLNTLFLKSSAQTPAQFMDQMVSRAMEKSVPLEARRSDGTTFPVEVSLNEITVREGKRLLTTILDVTERHEIERLKQEFVAMVSHDLKTPLSSVQGILGLIAARAFGDLSDRGMQLVGTAEVQVERLIKLISDLLLVEKLEAGKFDLSCEELQIEDIVQQALDTVRSQAESRGVELSLEIENTRVEADALRMVQVLVNLLSNAIKFSPPNGKVTVSSGVEEEWVVVRVSDQGRGVPEKARSRIFDRFKQVEDSDSREKGGTGLGLAICKQIIESHGGKIGVESEEGKGSTFWIRIPKTQQAVVSAAPSASELSD